MAEPRFTAPVLCRVVGNRLVTFYMVGRKSGRLRRLRL